MEIREAVTKLHHGIPEAPGIDQFTEHTTIGERQ
jgi:hypothetical protein